MTRLEIVTAAGRRLGDTSSAFLTILDGFFDDVLRDLAQAECISEWMQENDFDLVEAQEDYSTLVITQLAGNVSPVKILRIWIPGAGGAGAPPLFRQADSDYEYEALRAGSSDAQGTPRLWRIWPNWTTVQLWPPVDAGNAGVNLGKVQFLSHPTAIASGAELTEVPTEDFETVVLGIVARGAPFRDETMGDVDQALQLYERGKSLMWGRLHNSHPKRVVAQDF